MFSKLSSRAIPAIAFTAGAGATLTVTQASNDEKNPAAVLEKIFALVRKVETDLGIDIVVKKSVDPVGNFPYITDKHRSLTCKAIRADPSLYTKYANVRTPMGFSFDQAIQAGLDAPHLGVGIVAGEPAAYHAYKDIMDIVIEGWHGYKATDSHHSDMDASKIVMTPEQAAKFNKYVVSTRIRAGRSIDTLALPPSTDRKQRRLVEKLLTQALNEMPEDLTGIYYPLGAMTKKEEQDLQDTGFLFQKPTPNNVLSNCGAARDWPDARGIFHNKDKTFLVWVNEEDHMRCIAMQDGGNVKEVFVRWANAINSVEKSLNKAGYHYAHDEHLGYITTCPSNVGTGLRASVMLKLPKLYKKLGVHKLEELADSLGLQARGGRGEHSPPGPNGEFDISNKGRIGASEVELVQRMIDGVDKLIALEESA
eukprot:gene2267-2482_t